MARTFPGNRPSQILGVSSDLVALEIDAALALKHQKLEDEKLKMIVRAIYETMGNKVDFSDKIDSTEEFVSFERVMAHELSNDGTVIE